MKPSWDAHLTFQKVMKRIKSCKSTNLEKNIRVNGYIDHNEKNTMKPFWHVKHPAQKVMKRIKSYKSANVFLVHYSNRTTSRGTGPPPTQCIVHDMILSIWVWLLNITYDYAETVLTFAEIIWSQGVHPLVSHSQWIEYNKMMTLSKKHRWCNVLSLISFF